MWTRHAPSIPHPLRAAGLLAWGGALEIEFSPAETRPLPVLVVDDVPMVVEVVRAVLGQLGFGDVDAASDGADALTRMHGRRYGLVVSDCNMQPMTGLELLRHVRADRDLRQTPFVLMTTKENAGYFVRARQAGVNACLVKPFMPAAMQEAIASVMPVSNSQ